MPSKKTTILSAALVVASLGYFVDIYDLVLFSIVRVPSIADLGYVGKEALNHGMFLLNMQMAGMLVGGIIWGILGDKRGRLSVLFGSIFLYSIANILNGFATTITDYALWRFVAGIGLAGELGAGITLVAESLPKEKRGYGTMIVATVGVSGAVFAGLIAEYFNWRTNFFIGGALGLMLLVLRIGVFESTMFTQTKQKGVKRGNFLSLFTKKTLFKKYLKCILIGIPLWYVVGIPITFSPEFAAALHVQGTVLAGRAVMYCYLGLVFGDLFSGLISQVWRSRKKVVFLFLTMTTVLTAVLFNQNGITNFEYYLLCFFLGIGIGYWAIFVTVAAEQFGTNMRATVATSVPNFVRGAVVPTTLLFRYLEPQWGLIQSASIVGAICFTLAYISAYFLEETFDKDLNYLEAG